VVLMGNPAALGMAVLASWVVPVQVVAWAAAVPKARVSREPVGVAVVQAGNGLRLVMLVKAVRAPVGMRAAAAQTEIRPLPALQD